MSTQGPPKKPPRKSTGQSPNVPSRKPPKPPRAKGEAETPKMTEAEIAQEIKRNHILDEILSTERSYNTSLSGFLNNTIANQSIFETKLDSQRIQVGQMLAVSTELVTTLEQDKSISGLVNFFEKNGPALEVYKPYNANYSDYNADLNKDRETMTFGQQNNLTELNNIAIMPIQRLPRYILLFQELLKNTPPTHPDYEKIEKQLAAFKQLASEVNEGVRKKEMLDETQRFFKDNPLLIEPEARAKIEVGLPFKTYEEIQTIHKYAQHLKTLKDNKPSFFNVFQRDKSAAYNKLIAEATGLLENNQFDKETNNKIMGAMDAFSANPNPTVAQIEEQSRKIAEIKSSASLTPPPLPPRPSRAYEPAAASPQYPIPTQAQLQERQKKSEPPPKPIVQAFDKQKREAEAARQPEAVEKAQVRPPPPPRMPRRPT